MPGPSLTDYIGSLENPEGIFRTLAGVAIERDLYGEPRFRAGNSAAIFSCLDRGGARRFLKCYVRPNPHLRMIYDYVERLRSPLFPSVRLLRDELYVHTLAGDAGWVDVVEGGWVEGRTLDVAVTHAARKGDAARLSEIADAFDTLCEMLHAEEWAHGDLKPENIIVRADSPNVRLTLIDCDAMWIPSLTGREAVELGTPGWRDPERTAANFDKHIDDHPMALIAANLRAIAAEPELCARRSLSDGPVIFLA